MFLSLKVATLLSYVNITEYHGVYGIPHFMAILIPQMMLNHQLIGGLEHEFYFFHIILGMSSSQLTITHIFPEG